MVVCARSRVNVCFLYVMLLGISLLLSGCGGGGGGNGSLFDQDTRSGQVTLSGSITAAGGSVVDSDVNDPAAPYESNNQFTSAQSLSNNRLLNGYVTAVPTGNAGDRFATEPDETDVFLVNLTAGSQLSLRMAADSFHNDIDLAVFDLNENLVVSSSIEGITESVSISSDGDYYIVVSAVSGSSKYLLSFSAYSLANGYGHGQTANFVPGEAIVKYKNSQRVISTPSSGKTVSTRRDGTKITLKRWNLQEQSERQIQSKSSAFQNNLVQTNPNSYRKLQTLALIEELRADPEVEYAEPNYIRKPMLVPNDPGYSFQWHYPLINLPQAWDISTGSTSVVVAVVDTGVWLAHEDLAGQLVSGYDFISDLDTAQDGDGCDSNPNDPGDGDGVTPDSWHGTHVAGTIGALTDNAEGVAGVAHGARVMPLRAIGKGGGSSFDIIQAMRYAAGMSTNCGVTLSNPVEIINLSLGGEGYSQAEQDVVSEIVDNRGIMMAAAAGNEHSSAPNYPASYDGVISVSAVDANGAFVSRYSNYGDYVDIAAPGGNLSISEDGILSTFVTDGGRKESSAYAYFEGTSMATPHVAGVLALMKSIYPPLTPGDVDLLLRDGQMSNDKGTAGRDNFYGHGLLDALKSVQAAQNLATGNVKAALVFSPSSLTFNSSDTTNKLTVSKVGGSEPLSVLSVSTTQSWVSVSAQDVNSDGLGIYQVTVDRTGLIDGSYSATVNFTDSDDGILSVPVVLQVGVSNDVGDAGFVYILLLDAQSGETVEQVEKSASTGTYSFQFDVSPGSYQLIAGSDVDNDLTICTVGETCGGYPTLSDMSTLNVSSDQANLDFIINVTGTVSAKAVRNEPRVIEIRQAGQP